MDSLLQCFLTLIVSLLSCPFAGAPENETCPLHLFFCSFYETGTFQGCNGLVSRQNDLLGV